MILEGGEGEGSILLFRMYREQAANVKCTYTENLFDELRRRKTGFWIGIAGHADDLLRMAPSLDGLQDMIKTCKR